MSDEQSPSDLELELMAALRAGDASSTADDALAAHERALARAFAGIDDAEPEATPEELAAMAATPFEPSFLEALRAVDAPTDLPSTRHEQLLAPLLAAPPARRARRFAPATWASSGLALAAAVLLALRFGTVEAPHAVQAVDPDTVRSRTTESIVASAAAAGASTRVDRIAQARTGDYRKNRFRGWGAR